VKVTVRLLGPFRQYSSISERVLDLSEGATVSSALRALGDQLGPRFKDEFLESVDRVANLVLLNRSNLPISGWDTELNQGDVISLVPPMAGG
jgi:molybdopterin converting factor small subunit